MVDYNNPALTVEARFSADHDAVRKALELARDFLERSGCGGDAEARLCIIVEELVANLVEHGEPPPESLIMLELAAIGVDIKLTLSDAATPFDIRSAAVSGKVPPERGGGAGIALVLRWAHVMDYGRIDGRNVLKLLIPNNV